MPIWYENIRHRKKISVHFCERFRARLPEIPARKIIFLSTIVWYVSDKNGQINHQSNDIPNCHQHILSPTSSCFLSEPGKSAMLDLFLHLLSDFIESNVVRNDLICFIWIDLVIFGPFWAFSPFSSFLGTFSCFFMFKRGFETELNQYQIMIKWSGLSWVTNATIFRLFGPIQNETQLTESVLFTFNRFCSIHHVNFTLRKSPKNQFAPLAL